PSTPMACQRCRSTLAPISASSSSAMLSLDEACDVLERSQIHEHRHEIDTARHDREVLKLMTRDALLQDFGEASEPAPRDALGLRTLEQVGDDVSAHVPKLCDGTITSAQRPWAHPTFFGCVLGVSVRPHRERESA